MARNGTIDKPTPDQQRQILLQKLDTLFFSSFEKYFVSCNNITFMPDVL